MKIRIAAVLTPLLLLATPALAPAQQNLTGLPPGPYRAACDNLAIRNEPGRGELLMASCRDYQGRTVQTNIRLPCRGELATDRGGYLVCRDGRGGGNNNGRGNQGGGYDQSSRGYPPGRGVPPAGRIRLYGLKQYDGKALVLTAEAPNLRDLDFDETASSLKVERGRWQICTEAYYQGRCEIVDGDIPNLIAMRVNDQISSLRPWYPRDR